MSNDVSSAPGMKEISSPRFAAFYNWMMDQPLVGRGFDPLRREIVGQAQGVVLEVGAGGGQNFPFYDPTSVVRPDAHFDSVVVTLVFCSVRDPERGLREIWRVLKPGGTLLLLEHVRAHGSIAAWVQDALVPVTTRCMGNCHWNRDTQQAVLETGYQATQVRQLGGGLQPMLSLSAIRPRTQEERNESH